jgi:hypothetical protein
VTAVLRFLLGPLPLLGPRGTPRSSSMCAIPWRGGLSDTWVRGCCGRVKGRRLEGNLSSGASEMIKLG